MKPIAVVIITLFFLLSCRHAGQQEKKVSAPYDSTQYASTIILPVEEQKENLSKNEYLEDSLRLDFALNHALNITGKRLKDKSFSKEYEIQPGDSSYSIHVEIQIEDLFDDDKKYFLLRRQVPWATYIDIYKIVDSKIEKVISREQGAMSYIRDTIFDVNGDGYKDFVVHWYPSSGCCRRNIYNVYLNLPENGMFSSDYEFINPTFSPEEGIIRGVEYGHPGEVGLYKFMWNGLNVDTIEFIYPDVNLKGQFIKTKRSQFRPLIDDGIVLSSVPEEYHKIESYEWFSDF
jgi:hypothetical protein